MLKLFLNRVKVVFLSMLFLCLAASVAHAQGEPTTAESWQHYLLTTFLSLFVAMLTAAIPIVLPKLLSLLHLQQSAILNDEIESIVRDAVAHGQAWVQAQIDQKAPPPSPDAVQNKVMEYIVSQLQARKLPAQVTEYLVKLVQAELGRIVAQPTQGHAAMKAAFFRA